MVSEVSRRAVEMLVGKGFWMGRVGNNGGRDRFCIADTEREAEEWCRLTEKEMEGRADPPWWQRA